jgi:hypothetical protein
MTNFASTQPKLEQFIQDLVAYIAFVAEVSTGKLFLSCPVVNICPVLTSDL